MKSEVLFSELMNEIIPAVSIKQLLKRNIQWNKKHWKNLSIISPFYQSRIRERFLTNIGQTLRTKLPLFSCSKCHNNLDIQTGPIIRASFPYNNISNSHPSWMNYSYLGVQTFRFLFPFYLFIQLRDERLLVKVFLKIFLVNFLVLYPKLLIYQNSAQQKQPSTTHHIMALLDTVLDSLSGYGYMQREKAREVVSSSDISQSLYFLVFCFHYYYWYIYFNLLL